MVLDKDEVLYIDKRESRHSLRIVLQVGMRLPAHCTGIGKALLAYMHSSEVKQNIIGGVLNKSNAKIYRD